MIAKRILCSAVLFAAVGTSAAFAAPASSQPALASGTSVSQRDNLVGASSYGKYDANSSSFAHDVYNPYVDGGK